MKEADKTFLNQLRYLFHFLLISKANLGIAVDKAFAEGAEPFVHIIEYDISWKFFRIQVVVDPATDLIPTGYLTGVFVYQRRGDINHIFSGQPVVFEQRFQLPEGMVVSPGGAHNDLSIVIFHHQFEMRHGCRAPVSDG